MAIYIWKYWCHTTNNPSEETKSESSQIKEWQETIKLLNEEVAMLQQKKKNHWKSPDNELNRQECLRNF